MFNRNQDKTNLEKALDDLYVELANEEGDTDRYNKLTDQIKKLTKLRKEEKRATVSPDTLVLAGANIAGILIIVVAEHHSVIVSKALSFVRKAQ